MFKSCFCRRTARAEDQAELASVTEQISGSCNDWDEEALSAEEEGLVFFDGMSMQCPLLLCMTALTGIAWQPSASKCSPMRKHCKCCRQVSVTLLRQCGVCAANMRPIIPGRFPTILHHFDEKDNAISNLLLPIGVGGSYSRGPLCLTAPASNESATHTAQQSHSGAQPSVTVQDGLPFMAQVAPTASLHHICNRLAALPCPVVSFDYSTINFVHK